MRLGQRVKISPTSRHYSREWDEEYFVVSITWEYKQKVIGESVSLPRALKSRLEAGTLTVNVTISTEHEIKRRYGSVYGLSPAELVLVT